MDFVLSVLSTFVGVSLSLLAVCGVVAYFRNKQLKKATFNLKGVKL